MVIVLLASNSSHYISQGLERRADIGLHFLPFNALRLTPDGVAVIDQLELTQPSV